jgi:hypothetical protein
VAARARLLTSSAVAEGVFDNGHCGEHPSRIGGVGLSLFQHLGWVASPVVARTCSGGVAQGRHLDSAIVVAGSQRRYRVELVLFQDDVGRRRVGGDLIHGLSADDH